MEKPNLVGRICNGDMLATVLEEMPTFPSVWVLILAKLKKKKPGAAKVVEEATAQDAKPAAKMTPGFLFFGFLLFFFQNLKIFSEVWKKQHQNLTKRLSNFKKIF